MGIGQKDLIYFCDHDCKFREHESNTLKPYFSQRGICTKHPELSIIDCRELFCFPFEVLIDTGNIRIDYWAQSRSKNPPIFPDLNPDIFLNLKTLPWNQAHPSLTAKNATINRRASKCNILKQHYEIVKDDLERLSTDFIKRLSHISSGECMGADP